MPEQETPNRDEQERGDSLISRSVSRREFLKIAGIAGATVGMGAGLGGLLAACGEETPTTTAGGPATTAGGPATTAGGPATTVEASVEEGRVIKIGLAEPKTGPLASYAVPNDWWTEHAANAVKDGVVCGDKKLHKFEIVRVDTQSDSNRAAQVAGDMILNNKVDMILAAGSPDGTVPVADQCEANGTPGFFAHAPWQAMFKRKTTPAEGYKWIFGYLNGAEQTMLFANDADAAAWMSPTGAPSVFEPLGYTLVVPTFYQSGAEDFTAQISEFKKEGCEILCGTNSPPDFTNFWKQALQQGFHPVLATTGKALLFPQTLEAIGDIGYNLLGEMQWSPKWPFKDSLSGMTNQEMADDFEAKTGKQWTQVIGEYAMFEVAVNVFSRATDLEDKATVAAAFKTLNMVTCKGPIDFTAPVDPKSFHPCVNNVKPLYAGGQWIKGTAHKFDFVQCSNAAAPGTEVVAKVQPMVYA
jgi:branched-chain amino acid transport system substrate-binding protein